MVSEVKSNMNNFQKRQGHMISNGKAHENHKGLGIGHLKCELACTHTSMETQETQSADGANKLNLIA